MTVKRELTPKTAVRPRHKTAVAIVPPPAPVAPPIGAVASVLAAARLAHQRYRLQHAGRINKLGQVSHAPQLHDSGAAIQEALKLRLDAEAIDPQHTDPAWLTDAEANKGQTSAAMVAFLSRYLTPIATRG